jgi:hypothetical protein
MFEPTAYLPNELSGFPDDMDGTYFFTGVKNKRPVYKSTRNDWFLYFTNFGDWMVGRKEDVHSGFRGVAVSSYRGILLPSGAGTWESIDNEIVPSTEGVIPNAVCRVVRENTRF